jgi:hypothetical protein
MGRVGVCFFVHVPSMKAVNVEGGAFAPEVLAFYSIDHNRYLIVRSKDHNRIVAHFVVHTQPSLRSLYQVGKNCSLILLWEI